MIYNNRPPGLVDYSRAFCDLSPHNLTHKIRTPMHEIPATQSPRKKHYLALRLFIQGGPN